MTASTGPEEFDPDLVLALAADLVRMGTVNAPGAAAVETPAVLLLADLMRGFGWDVTVTEVAPGRPSLIAVVHGTPATGRTLMFEGHVDVVTEGEVAGWSFDPYAADVVDGRLRGRGSADMKAGVAAMVWAARAVELAGFGGTLVLGVLADEEGMMLGAKHFARQLGAGEIAGVRTVDGVIVCEPEGGEVCPVAKGAIRISITVIGVMAHGAMPAVGRNPLPALASLVIALGEVERRERSRVGTHPLLGDFSLTPTVMVGGSVEQLNVIPATATLALDVRTVPGNDHGEVISVISTLAHTLAAERGLRAELIVLDDRPPVDTSAGSPIVRAMLAGHLAATGSPAVIGGVPGTTDGTILSRDAGLDTVVYGPGGKWIAHQVDEFVAVRDILDCTRAYIAAARHFLTHDGNGDRPTTAVAR